jgi:pyruvate dehydrogenase E1 component alpha subunit
VDLLKWYREMLLIRVFEESVGRLFTQGLAPGTSHLSIGQEACAVGAVSALDSSDQVFSTHRGHGHFLAKGGDPMMLMAEILGRSGGYGKGFGGSQHTSYPPIGFIGTNGITGGNIPVATGAALATKTLGTGRVVICFFGDGASNQGTFHESLNMASLWKLPIIFFVENNRYAQWTSVARSTSVESIATRGIAYNTPGVTVDGMDVSAVYAVTTEAVKLARSGGGPTLIEAETYRLTGHSKSDVETTMYRPEKEEQAWYQRDPIHLLRDRILNDALADNAELVSIENDVSDSIEEATQQALDSPIEDLNSAFTGVYANRGA